MPGAALRYQVIVEAMVADEDAPATPGRRGNPIIITPTPITPGRQANPIVILPSPVTPGRRENPIVITPTPPHAPLAVVANQPTPIQLFAHRNVGTQTAPVEEAIHPAYHSLGIQTLPESPLLSPLASPIPGPSNSHQNQVAETSRSLSRLPRSPPAPKSFAEIDTDEFDENFDFSDPKTLREICRIMDQSKSDANEAQE